MRKVASATIIVILLLLSTFLGLFHFTPTVEAGDVPDVWTSDSTLVNGLPDVGDDASPALAYNLTMDGQWTLISGDALGNFHGFYWNGSGWTEDASRVAGLGNIGGEPGGWNYSTPYIVYNFTGDGKWVLISGRYSGDFRSFYLNFTPSGYAWVEDSQYVNGLGTIGTNSHPSIAFNVTGDGNWILIAGEDNGFHGFYWNGTQWVENASLVTGLRVVESDVEFHPDMAFNVRGDGRWCLIAGGYAYPTYGYEWNGTQWVYCGLAVANFIWQVGDQAGVHPALVYNFSGDGYWQMICGGRDGQFYGLTLKAPTEPNQIVELGRVLLSTGNDYVYAFEYHDGYLYGGTQTSPGRVVKVSAGTLEEEASFALSSNDGHTIMHCVEIVGDYLYLGNWKLPEQIAKIVKVDLTTFTYVSTLTLTGVTRANDLASDGTYLYAACYQNKIVRINLEDFTQNATLTLTDSPSRLLYENGYLYAGSYNGYLFKIDVSTFSVVATLDADPNLANTISCLASKGDGWLYAGYTDSSPVGYIRRVNLTTFERDARLQVGASGSGIHVDYMVIIGDGLFFLDTMFIRYVHLPSFTVGTSIYRSTFEYCFDMATDGFYIYLAPGTSPAHFQKFYFTGVTLHKLTVTSNPSVPLSFKLDGNIYTTPYVTNVPHGDHTFQIVDPFPKVGNYFLVYSYWTVNGVNYDGGDYGYVTASIENDSLVVLNYHVGVLQLTFDEDFETGTLQKWGQYICNPYGEPWGSLNASSEAAYEGSYGLYAYSIEEGPYGRGFAYAYTSYSNYQYVYVNLMVRVTSGNYSGTIFYVKPSWLNLGYYTVRVDWCLSNFHIDYWWSWDGGQHGMTLGKSISGFQFDTWMNLTMFIKFGINGFYAFWINNQLKWYLLNFDNAGMNPNSLYIGASGTVSTAYTEDLGWVAYPTIGKNYFDDVKIYSFVDPTFYTLNVYSTPVSQVTVKVDGVPYVTNFSLMVEPGTHEIALVDVAPTVNGTPYVFTGWTVETIATGETETVNSATFTLNVDANKQLIANFATGGFRREEWLPPPPEEEQYCLPLIFWILMAATFFVGLYLFSQRETWKIGIPLIPTVLWLIIFKPKTPITQMHIAILRLFLVPPWHLYMAVILTAIAAIALLSKK